MGKPIHTLQLVVAALAVLLLTLTGTVFAAQSTADAVADGATKEQLRKEIRLLRRICGLASKRLVDNNLIKCGYSLILRAETLGSLDRTSWTV